MVLHAFFGPVFSIQRLLDINSAEDAGWWNACNQKSGPKNRCKALKSAPNGRNQRAGMELPWSDPEEEVAALADRAVGGARRALPSSMNQQGQKQPWRRFSARLS
jgi:hypothetical protein